MVDLAARRRDRADLRRMRAALDLRTTALDLGNVEAAADADIDFHLGTAFASKNAVLADLFQAFTIALKPTIGYLMRHSAPSYRKRSREAHEELYQAIRDRAASRATGSITAYLKLATRELESLDVGD